jgi:hypothetical protein
MSSSDSSQSRANLRAAPTGVSSLLAYALVGICLVFVLGGAVWHSSRFVEHSSLALAFPLPLDGLEGTLLHEAWLWRAGEALYQPLQPDRFVSSPYPPMHYVLLALFAPADWQGPHVFFEGRFVSLGVSLITAFFLAALSLRQSRSLALAIVAVGLWLAFAPVQLWATRIKPDPLALTFTMAGLFVISFYNPQDPRKSARRLLVPGVALCCFVAAYFTKQTAVVAPASVCLAFFLAASANALRRDRSLKALWQDRAVWWSFGYGFSYLLMVGLIWACLDLVTRGQYTFHIWGLHRSEWWSFELMSKFLELLAPSWPLLLLALIGLIKAGLALFRAQTIEAKQLIPACYMLAAPFTLFGAGEIGANHNHLLETHLALVLISTSLVGSLVHSLQIAWKEGQGQAKLWQQSALACVGIGLLTLQFWNFVERPAWYGNQFDPLDNHSGRYLALIRSQPGEVLADDVALLVAAGRPLRYDDPSTMGPAVESGVWDESHLIEEVRQQHFSVIMLPIGPKETVDAKGRWTSAFLTALHESYKPLYRDRITTYVPR